MAYNFFSKHFIRIFCRRLGIPKKPIYNFLRFVSSVSPNSFEERHIISREQSSLTGLIDRHSGFYRFDEKAIPVLKDVIDDCTRLYDEKIQQYDADYFVKNPNKGFLLTLSSDQELLKIPSIYKLITSEFVLDTVYSYLQQPFVLSTIRLWWSVVNETEIRSQKFHIDDEDLTQVKMFINISDITEDHGPFKFITADLSDQIISQNNHAKHRLTDNEVSASMEDIPVVALTGNRGEGGFVDTSRCLHFGSRANKFDRLVLMAQFLKFDAPLLKGSLPIFDRPGNYS
ncbi:MAG: hypothetical protein AAF372_03920 [Pseudomonadota bacterium]